ncbi:exosome component 10 isoform X1 [Aedes aegypti]|uniref:Exosome complex component 10 homolog n=1 Tax=Aedes aegypti TaxID=7159 RepID=A0A1S4FNZ8_AEDAE|nr:exosome component 10 isoform X1 [Aedes aegypti]
MNSRKSNTPAKGPSRPKSAQPTPETGGGSRSIPPIDASPIRTYTDGGQKLLLDGMKSVLALPSGNSRDLYDTHPSFVRIMDTQANKVLHMISDVLKLHEIKGNIVVRDREEKFELLQEFNDSMLERINSNLDEVAGIKKKHETVLVQSEIQLPAEPRQRLSGSWNNASKTPAASVAAVVKATLVTGTNIQRPQVNFKVPVDNSPLNPFVPKIKEKPNSMKPLAVLPEYDEAGNIVSYLHPYEFELDRFEPSKEALKEVEPEEPLKLESTPLDIIDKESQLPGLLKELKAAKELAIDLEHHSYRTYQGFTCLMQISTRSKDYIIDTLALREELHILNEVFTNPKVVKVLHGAISDIEWLQRDLSLYIVNMFDTGEAAKVLEFSRIGLQFLLKHYCNIDTDKAYQLADWRIRPIPHNFIEYARKDTHYLLYIYDRMRNELIAKGASFLPTVYNKSTYMCKQRYVKPVINEDAIMNIYRRSKHVFDQRQMYAFREILYWRDKLARQEDESPGYVLPQHMALDIASKLPREMQGIIACCTPVPSLVRQHLHTIHQIILKAREISLNKSVAAAIEHQKDTRHKMQSTFDLNNPLFCPHDSSQGVHLETNLPTLLNSTSKIGVCEKVLAGMLKEQPDAGVFEESKTRTLDEKGRLILDSNMSEDTKMANFIEAHYQAKQLDGNQSLNGSIYLSYQDRKFNTPYERHLETCRNRYQNEEPEEEEQDKRLKPVVKQETDKPVESTEVKSEPVMDSKLPLKAQKRQEEREAKRKLVQTESADKIRFSNFEPPKKKEKTDRRSKGEFPLQIKPTVEQNNDHEDAASDEDDEEDERNVSGQSSQNNSFANGGRKGKNKKKKFKKQGKAGQKEFKQSSNKPVPFDYGQVDYNRFQGGSRPLPQKGKGNKFFARKQGQGEDTTAGEGSTMKKTLHPNSRIAKGIKQSQKMFNFSSNNLQKKK